MQEPRSGVREDAGRNRTVDATVELLDALRVILVVRPEGQRIRHDSAEVGATDAGRQRRGGRGRPHGGQEESGAHDWGRGGGWNLVDWRDRRS